MDEYAWLTVCFIAFVALTYKAIIKAISSMINNAEAYIASSVKEAENIYLQAEEKNQEAKNLFAQLEITKKYIMEKEERETEFDLKNRQEAFEDALAVRKTQLENVMKREINDLKNTTLHSLNKVLKEKFIQHLAKDQKLTEHYTNLMLDQ